MTNQQVFCVYRWVAVILSVALLPGVGFAVETKTGLKTNYSKVAVANLPIGQTVSMTQIANAPMIIGNNHEIPVYIQIHTEIPPKPKDGYEPIPDASWVAVEPNGITLPANASAPVDVKITIPNDEKLFGKKYLCHIIIHTEGDPNYSAVRFGTQITGQLMFSIAPEQNVEALDAALKNPADADFEIVPPAVIVENVKPGQKLKVLSETKKKIELINHSKKKQEYWLYAVDPRETGYSMLNSKKDTNINDVTIVQEQIKLGPGKKKALDIVIQIPQEADFSKEAWAYLISITNGAKQGQGVNRYLAIYLKGTPASAEPKLENAAPQGVTTSAEIKNK